MGREGEGIALALGMHMHDALACFCARSCSLIIYLESLRNISQLSNIKYQACTEI
jgi:hypothetical protein